MKKLHIHTLRVLAVFFLLAAFAAGPAGIAAAASPEEEAQATIEGFLEAIRGMEFPASRPEHQQGLVARANAALDLKTMSMTALTAHWQSADAAQQNAFLDLMGQLVEAVAYPRSVEFLGDLEIRYPEVRDNGGGIDVHSVVVHEEEALNAPVVYHLHPEGGAWRIDDVFLDDVSITEDLQYQFDKIIDESGFDGLLERMREKLARAREKNEGASG